MSWMIVTGGTRRTSRTRKTKMRKQMEKSLESTSKGWTRSDWGVCQCGGAFFLRWVQLLTDAGGRSGRGCVGVVANEICSSAMRV